MKPELRDIQLPVEIGIWPLAPAWWAIIMVIILIVIAIVWYKGSTLRRQKRLVKFMLQDTGQRLLNLKTETDHLLVLQTSNQVVKKYVMNVINDKAIAQLHHAEWVNYCESIAKPFTFRKTTRYLLSSAMYQPELEFDINNYIDELQIWLKQSGKNV